MPSSLGAAWPELMTGAGLVSQATAAYDHRYRRLEHQRRAGRVKTVVGVDEEPRIKCRPSTVVGVLPQAVVERNGQAGALLPREQCSLVRVHVAGRAIDADQGGAHVAGIADYLAVVFGVPAVVHTDAAAFQHVANGVWRRLGSEYVPGGHHPHGEVADLDGVPAPHRRGPIRGDAGGEDFVRSQRRADETRLLVTHEPRD